MIRGRVWRESDFVKLWTGQTISQMGSRISRDGIPLAAVLVLGATPLQMGYLGGASGIAILIFGLFAGAWADRLRRRPLMILTDLARAGVLASIPVAACLHRRTMGHLYAAAAVTGILTVLFDISYQAYVPALVNEDNILEANSKLALTESIAEVAGPGVTGVLVQLITAPMAILFDAVSFVVSAVSLSLIRRAEPPPERREHADILHEIREGLTVAWRNPILRAIALRTGTAAFFMGFISSLYMVFAIRELRLTPAVLGMIISVGGVTSLFGAVAAERVARRFGVGPSIIGAAMLTGIAALLIPLARGPVVVCAAVLGVSQLLDVAWPVYNINELTLRQSVTPNHLLGRANAAIHLLFQGILPAGALAGGVLAQATSMRTTMLIGSTGYLLSTMWLIFSPVRKLQTGHGG